MSIADRKRFVVKVQLNLLGPGTLVHNPDNAVYKKYSRVTGKRILGTAVKGFFWAHLEETVLHIDDHATEEDFDAEV